MDYQGAQEEPEGRRGGPANGKRARETPLSCFKVPVVPAFLLALPWLPGNPSSYPYLEACSKRTFMIQFLGTLGKVVSLGLRSASVASLGVMK